MTGPALAAVEAFFASKRGDRKLREPDRDALVVLFRDLGLTIAEIPTDKPSAAARHKVWLEEWSDAAVDAGITGNMNLRNVTRWIDEEDSASISGVRASKAGAVADALTKKGLSTTKRASTGTGVIE